jgi:hypothetical protein
MVLVKSPLELEFRMAGLHPRLASKCTESSAAKLQGSRRVAWLQVLQSTRPGFWGFMGPAAGSWASHSRLGLFHARKALLSRIGQSVILSRSLSLIFNDLSYLLLPLYDLRVLDHGQAQTGQSLALTGGPRGLHSLARTGPSVVRQYPHGIWP